MVSIVTPTFKNFSNPVRPEMTAKHAAQDINSLIFNVFSLIGGIGCWEKPALN